MSRSPWSLTFLLAVLGVLAASASLPRSARRHNMQSATSHAQPRTDAAAAAFFLGFEMISLSTSARLMYSTILAATRSLVRGFFSPAHERSTAHDQRVPTLEARAREHVHFCASSNHSNDFM